MSLLTQSIQELWMKNKTQASGIFWLPYFKRDFFFLLLGSLLSFFKSSTSPTNKQTDSTKKQPTQPIKDAGLITHTSTTKTPTTPTCSHSDVYHHVTLKGGLKAGTFRKLAEISNIGECAKKCCARQKCDVAIMMSDTCFGLQCNSTELCETKPAHLKHFRLVMVYIQRNGPRGENRMIVLSCFIWRQNYYFFYSRIKNIWN